MADPKRAERLQRLLEAWGVIYDCYQEAERFNDLRRLAALKIIMKIVDAVVTIEEGGFAERDKYGQVTSEPYLDVLARLRDIAIARDIFGEFKAPPVEPPDSKVDSKDRLSASSPPTELFARE